MILNLHGMYGNCNNHNYRLLASKFGESSILSPQFEYQSMQVVDIILECRRMVTSSLDSLQLIVGNSFGGFISSILAMEYSVPFILTNPCLRPDKSLESIVPGYVTKNKDAINYYIDKLQNTDVFVQAKIIFGKDDEVLDISDALNMIPDSAERYIISGGHRLSSSEYEMLFNQLLTSTLN